MTQLAEALIGYTGFVGGTLYRARAFDAVYNSRNIEAIAGRQFDQIICAGVSAVKYLANRDPEADWQSIRRLMDQLERLSVQRFVLISTVDVYKDPRGLTERDRPSIEGLHPYGRHRLALERFVAERFQSHTIVRLPALFGEGLKKNALFDLMHAHRTEHIVPNVAFQWYPLSRLAGDLLRIQAANVPLINITTQPVTMSDVQARFFPDAKLGHEIEAPASYDLHSIHDALLGGHDGYHLHAADVWDAMATFLASAATP